MQGMHRPDKETPSRRRILKAAVLGGGALAIPGAAYASQAVSATGTAAPRQATRPLQTFTHPGILHTQEAFDRMAEHVTAGTEPWLAGWNRLTANDHSAASWAPNPQETIIRGTGGSGPQNYPILYNDIHAAYQNALRWKITGDTVHGDTARDICNAWSETLQVIDTIPSDSRLASGIYGYQFANVGEIIRDYEGFDLARFQDLMQNVFYPLNTDFLVRHNDTCETHYWANWDLCNMASIMAIGILRDDQAQFDEAVDYFYNGVGTGSIANAIPFVYDDVGLAQWQESGRDQAHSIMGIGLMGTLCEMAWNQGVDLYAAEDYKFRKACEYVARYNLGYDDVPFTTYANCEGQEHTVISESGRSEVRPVWERVFHHYWGRLEQDCPNMQEISGANSPEGGGGDYSPNSGGFDELGFGTLAYVDRLVGE
ncbi:alginate lyase family protein [Streptomyces sp. MP131-18]|uniref:alginate lyase family protein n=1 Tax=Streptomyces sp. MP131-18 TaxID=1857892 RepID=UPI0009CAEE53|nr:alginate lyase family protein [Streptomyces sp. MP131-18]ONK09568.1 Alginate lyase [Streptomyces sp. MP131-18]